MCTITDLTAIVTEPKMTVDETVVYPTLDAMLEALEPEQEPDDFMVDDIVVDYVFNVFCDFSGFCAGYFCLYFFKC